MGLVGVLYNGVVYLCVWYLCSGRVLETQGGRGVLDFCVCVWIEEEGQCIRLNSALLLYSAFSTAGLTFKK